MTTVPTYKKPKDMAKIAALVQEIIQSEAGYKMAEKYCKRSGNWLYAEYMKEKTRRMLEKVSENGGILL